MTRALNLDANEAYAVARRGSALLDYSPAPYLERSARLCVALWGSLMALHLALWASAGHGPLDAGSAVWRIAAPWVPGEWRRSGGLVCG